MTRELGVARTGVERVCSGRFAFGPIMEELCRKLVGPDAYLFYDQFVVKGAEAGMKLSWL